MKEDSTQHYYEMYACDYFRLTHKLDLPHLWTKLEEKLKPGALILDLGCGSGRDLLHFSQRGFSVIGLDYSLNLLMLAKEFAKQPLILGDIKNLPFKDNVFDAVWSIGSLLHIPRHLISPVLFQIHKILKPDSLFLTSVKKGYGETIDPLGRYTVFYQPQEWARLLSENGFKIAQLEEYIEKRKTDSGEEKEINWIVCLAFSQNRGRMRGSDKYEAVTALS